MTSGCNSKPVLIATSYNPSAITVHTFHSPAAFPQLLPKSPFSIAAPTISFPLTIPVVQTTIRLFGSSCFATNLSAAISVYVTPPKNITTTVFLPAVPCSICLALIACSFSTFCTLEKVSPLTFFSMSSKPDQPVPEAGAEARERVER